MRNEHIEEFEAWWIKTTFEATRGWSRDGERKFLPCSPRKLARAAWNAAWHILGKDRDQQIAKAHADALRRILVFQATLDRAKAEIDVLERRAPMPDSEFHARLLKASNALLSAKVRALQGQSTAVTPSTHEALRCAIEAAEMAENKRSQIVWALRNALATYEEAARAEHIIPRCANALEDRIREIVGE